MSRSKIITHYEDQDWFGTIVSEPWGFSVLDSHPHCFWKDGGLYMASMQVRVTDRERDQLQGKIPVWLVARDFNGHFICGFDLLENGNVWTGHNRKEYSNPYEAIIAIMEHNLKECSHRSGGFASFSLSLEEPMALSND